MLHACPRVKPKQTSTPDEICNDFRRVLRDRAINHSQYYRQLSTSNKFPNPLNHCSCQPTNSNQTDKTKTVTADANNISHNRLRKTSSAITKSPLNPPNKSSSSSHPQQQESAMASPRQYTVLVPPRPNSSDKVAVVVNHQSAILNVDKIQLTDRSVAAAAAAEQIDDNSGTKVDMSMTSMVANKHAMQIASSSASANATNGGDSNDCGLSDSSYVDSSNRTFARDGGEPKSPSHEQIASIANDYGVGTENNDDIITASAADSDDSVSALDGDNKSSVSTFAFSSAIAINNNNKTCPRHIPNRSNYSTFVRETSSLSRSLSLLERSSDLCACLNLNREKDQQPDLSLDLLGEKVESVDRDSKNCITLKIIQSVCAKYPGAHTKTDSSKIDVISPRSNLIESGQIEQSYNFPCVDKLVKMYTKLLQDKKGETKSATGEEDKSKALAGKGTEDCEMKSIEGLRIKDEKNRNSSVSDEGYPLGASPCSSDMDDLENEKERAKVARSSSSDSALDLDDEQPMEPPPNMNTGRRMTLTVTDIPLRAALLPVPEPHSLPDSTTSAETSPLPATLQTAVPSKVILEERLVEIPEDKFPSVSNSRRESALTCLSDFDPIEAGAVRYVRTPSVVVSDYSDDILCGVTLEEIEYFRAHRMRRRSSADTNHTEKDDVASDVSAASSCSNLDYCGSTISGLDGNEYYVNGERVSIDRKVSDCSTCSTGSGDDEEEGAYIQNQDYDQQQKEDALQRERRKKIPVKARHPKFIN